MVRDRNAVDGADWVVKGYGIFFVTLLGERKGVAEVGSLTHTASELRELVSTNVMFQRVRVLYTHKCLFIFFYYLFWENFVKKKGIVCVKRFELSREIFDVSPNTRKRN